MDYGEETVQLGTVVQRHGVDLDVADAHLSVDDAADVLRDQAAAGQRSALRPSLGAAGVEQLQRVVVGERDIGGRGVRVLHPGLQRFPAARGAGAVLADHPAQPH